MNSADKAREFGREMARRMPELTKDQLEAIASAYTFAQHGHPSTSQGIASADRTWFRVMTGWQTAQ